MSWIIQSRESHFIGVISDKEVNSFYGKMIKKEVNNLSLQMCPEVPFLLLKKEGVFSVLEPASSTEYPLDVYLIDKPLLNKKGEDCLINKKMNKVKSKEELDSLLKRVFGNSQRK